MRKNFLPVCKLPPEVDGLVVTSVRNTGRHLEWSYYHPDDCTVDGRHIRVRYDPHRQFQSRLQLFERSRPIDGLSLFFDRIPSIASVVKSVSSHYGYLFDDDNRPLYGSLEERDAARLCLEAGFHHPGLFRDAWTMPSNDPNVLFYIRAPLSDREGGDSQYIVTDSNGPVTRLGWVEAGAARISGTHRVSAFATSLEEAIGIVLDGEVQPQDSSMPDPGTPRMIPMSSRKWAERERAAGRDPDAPPSPKRGF